MSPVFTELERRGATSSMRGEVTSLFAEEDTRRLFLTDGRTEFFTDGIETAAQGYRPNKWTNLG